MSDSQRADQTPPRRSRFGWLDPYFRDPGLWPVLLAATLIAVTLGSALLWMALHDRNGFALVGLLAAGALTADLALRDLRRRTLGASGIALALWGLCAAAAVAYAWLGIG